jgi:hypothetical protein
LREQNLAVLLTELEEQFGATKPAEIAAKARWAS